MGCGGSTAPCKSIAAGGAKHTAKILFVGWALCWFSGVPMGLAAGVFYLPAIILVKVMPGVRAKRFKKHGAAPLLAYHRDAAKKHFAAGGHTRPAEVNAGDGLTSLAALLQQGLLTDEEWDRAKALYLGKGPDARAQAVSMLGQMYSLYQQGALSESEYNMKKWEILSRESHAGH